MGRASPSRRKKQISQERKRRLKLKKLRQKYLSAKGLMDKEKIIEKAQRLAPWLTKENFLRPIESRKKTTGK